MYYYMYVCIVPNILYYGGVQVSFTLCRFAAVRFEDGLRCEFEFSLLLSLSSGGLWVSKTGMFYFSVFKSDRIVIIISVFV